MVDIQEVAEGIYRFETTVPAVDTTFSTFLIRSPESVLVEPGPGAIIPAIMKAIEQLGIQTPSYIIPTHIHMDHGGAAGELAEIFPQAQVVVHPRAAIHLIDPSRLINGTIGAFGPDFEKRFGPILPVPEAQIKVPDDGETIDIGGRGLTIVYAPGHIPHHIAIFDQNTSSLFCGEALGSVPIQEAPDFPLPSVVPPSFDMEDYLDTIEKLRNIKPRMLLYSHQGIGNQPDKLIRCALDNTHAIGDIILKSLKEAESRNQIGYRVREYISNQLGFKVESIDLELLISGYSVYFSKKYCLPLTD